MEARPMLIPLDWILHLGPRAVHLEGDYGTSPQQTPPDLRERT